MFLDLRSEVLYPIIIFLIFNSVDYFLSKFRDSLELALFSFEQNKIFYVSFLPQVITLQFNFLFKVLLLPLTDHLGKNI